MIVISYSMYVTPLLGVKNNPNRQNWTILLKTELMWAVCVLCVLWDSLRVPSSQQRAAGNSRQPGKRDKDFFYFLSFFSLAKSQPLTQFKFYEIHPCKVWILSLKQVISYKNERSSFHSHRPSWSPGRKRKFLMATKLTRDRTSTPNSYLQLLIN